MKTKTKKTRFYLLGLLGAFSLLTQPAFAAPANDNFANAETIVGDTPTTNGFNIDATMEPGEPTPPTAIGRSVWYKWTPTLGGDARFDTFGSEFDTVLAVYTQDDVNGLQPLTYNDDFAPGYTYSEVKFFITPNTTYYLQVAGYQSGNGPIKLNLTRFFSIKGRVANASNVGVQGVKIAMEKVGSGVTFFASTDASGNYTFENLISGSYTATPTLANLSFTPASRTFEANGPTTGINFVATTNVKPSISITNATVTEGDSGSQNAAFDVKLSAASALPVTVSYATSNDTAVAPNDYNSAANNLTFAPGELTKKVYIAVKGDTIDEIDERYNVNLTNPVNATVNDNLGVGFITDDDAPPALSIDSPSISEGNAGTKVLNFKVKLSVASSKTVTVSAKTTPAASTATTDPATAAVDYVALPATTITFAPGELTKTIGVTVNADVIDELNETFNVVLSAPGNATIGVNTGVGTINDDDATPSLSINDVTVTEGDSGTQNAAFTVSLSAASGRTVKVFLATQDNTALAGLDYVALDDYTVTLLPGQTSKVVNVAVKGDLIDENDETYQVKLSYPENAGIADSLGIGTIIDNDNVPAISVAAPSVVEGNNETVPLPFILKLSVASGKVITVKVQTTPAATDPATPNLDFVPVNLTTVTIPAGVTQQPFYVNVKGEYLDEVNEKIGFTLSAPTNATLTTTNVEGTIIDDDSAPSFNIDNITLEEGNSGNTVVNFPITLSNPSGKTVSIKFKTGNSATTPATAGVDYIAVPETVITFAPGQTFKNAPVSVVGDLFFEDNEVFLGLFSSPVNATLEGNSRTALIYNDDEEPELSINSTTLTEGNSGTKTATLTVTLSKAANTNVTVKYLTVDVSSASAGEDYVAQNGTLTFTPGQLSKTVNITIKGDTIYEGESEFFYVDLTEPVGTFTGSGQAGTVTITDDDPIPSRSGSSS